MHKALVILALFTMSHAFAVHKLKFELKETPINLAHYDPRLTIDASVSADGQFFAQVSQAGPVFLYNLAHPNKVKTVVMPNEKIGEIFLSVAFSPTGRFVIIDSTLPNAALLEHGMLKILDTASGQIIAEFRTSIFAQDGHSTYAFSPSDKYVALVLDNKSTGEIVSIFDLDTRKPRDLEIRFSCFIGALVFDTSENILAIKDICEGDINIWDIKKNQAITKISQTLDFSDIFYSPIPALTMWGNNNYLAEHSTMQNLMQVWDINTKENIFQTSWLDFLPILTSPDRKSLVIADVFGQINILQAQNTTILTATPFETFDMVGAASYNPQGNLLAVASVQGEVALLNNINYSTCGEADTADNSSVVQFAFNSQNSFITLYDSGLLSLWRISN